MSITEELQIQRDFIAKNNWVRGTPFNQYEACLAYRNCSAGTPKFIYCISQDAFDFLGEFMKSSYGALGITSYNDMRIENREEALSVLDKAIIASEEIVK
jgi:hypothetical protein